MSEFPQFRVCLLPQASAGKAQVLKIRQDPHISKRLADQVGVQIYDRNPSSTLKLNNSHRNNDISSSHYLKLAANRIADNIKPGIHVLLLQLCQ